jgi:hypothetical protein
MGDWLDCDFLRHVHARSCIVRVRSTGAVLQIGLGCPLDTARACMVSPLKPVPCRLQLADGLQARALSVEWPEPMSSMPPPIRFQRKAGMPVNKQKRRRPVDE